MKSGPRRWISCAVLALALAGPRAAGAEDAADLRAARAAFQEGSMLAGQKRWREACDRYALSLKLHPAALTLYSLGVAQREAGRLVAARASFESFLAEPVSPKTTAYTEPARSAITELGDRAASLAVVLAPAPAAIGAEVTLDGVALPAGTFTQRRLVDPGTHEVVARAPGRIEARSRVTLPEGGSVTLTLTLLPSSDAAGVVSTPTAEPPKRPGSRGAPWPTALPFALLGVGGAAIVGGAALGLVGLAEARNASSERGPAANDARMKGLAGDVLAASGVAMAGVGLVLLLVQRSAPPAGLARTWIAGPGGVSMTF